jgi:hypothetical protein
MPDETAQETTDQGAAEAVLDTETISAPEDPQPEAAKPAPRGEIPRTLDLAQCPICHRNALDGRCRNCGYKLP